MKPDINNLNNKMLLKRLEYTLDRYNYLIFIENIIADDLFPIEETDEIQQLSEEKTTSEDKDTNKKSDNQISDEEIEDIVDEEKVVSPQEQKIKKLYRTIVKKIHPDKIGEVFVDIYKKATEFNSNGQYINLCLLAINIDIPVFLTKEDIDDINTQVHIFEHRIKLLEKSDAIKYYNENIDYITFDENNKIILSY